MKIPINSPIFKLPMTTEFLNEKDVEIINEWIKKQNPTKLILCIVFIVSAIIFFVSFSFMMSPGIRKSPSHFSIAVSYFISLGAFLISGKKLITSVFSHSTDKTLNHKKKRIVTVSINDKVARDAYYLYFDEGGAYCTLSEEKEWEKYQVGQKIKFHLYIDQNSFFRYEIVE